jgi:hypothetical protein
MANPTREEMTANLEAVEARTDTKIARLEGKIDLVLSKLDGVREDGRATRANQWVIGFGLAGLIVALVVAFPAFFDIGSKVRDMIREEARRTEAPQPTAPPQAPTTPQRQP